MNPIAPSTPSPKLALMILCAAALAACGSGGTVDAGPPPNAQSYFNLKVGTCWLYAVGDGGTPSVAVDVQPVLNPPGVKLVRTRAGNAADHSDYLEFDGGTVLLDKTEDDPSTGQVEVAYVTGIPWLQAPLPLIGTTINGASTAVISVGTATTTETTGASGASSIQSSGAWTGTTGPAAADAGFTETVVSLQINFSDGGGQLTETGVTPGIGITTLHQLPEGNGLSADYVLVKIESDDGGCFIP